MRMPFITNLAIDIYAIFEFFRLCVWELKSSDIWRFVTG